MIQSIKILKVGNHLYPDINHSEAYEIQLSEKIERVLQKYISIHQELNGDSCEIVFYEQYDIIADRGILQFKEADIVKYLTTDDDFDLTFYIDDHEFTISSDLYSLLEQQFNFNFHKTLYRIEIW